MYYLTIKPVIEYDKVFWNIWIFDGKRVPYTFEYYNSNGTNYYTTESEARESVWRFVQDSKKGVGEFYFFESPTEFKRFVDRVFYEEIIELDMFLVKKSHDGRWSVEPRYDNLDYYFGDISDRISMNDLSDTMIDDFLCLKEMTSPEMDKDIMAQKWAKWCKNTPVERKYDEWVKQ